MTLKGNNANAPYLKMAFNRETLPYEGSIHGFLAAATYSGCSVYHIRYEIYSNNVEKKFFSLISEVGDKGCIIYKSDGIIATPSNLKMTLDGPIYLTSANTSFGNVLLQLFSLDFMYNYMDRFLFSYIASI